MQKQKKNWCNGDNSDADKKIVNYRVDYVMQRQNNRCNGDNSGVV